MLSVTVCTLVPLERNGANQGESHREADKWVHHYTGEDALRILATVQNKPYSEGKKPISTASSSAYCGL